MATRNFSSTAAETTLSAGISAVNTSIQVAATTGFPPAPFILALDAGASAQELVLVTNVAGLTLTVTRGYDSTVAVAHDVGAVVQHSHAAIDLREANDHVNASDGVHGVTGDLVGTTDTQTLTNKTVALGSNTVSGTTAQFNTALTDGDFATLAGTETLTNKTLTAPAATGSLASFGGAWTAYTPTLGGGAVLGTGGTLTGGYVQIGKTVHYWAKATFGTGLSVPGGLSISLPVAKKTSLPDLPADCFLIDSSPGSYYRATARLLASNDVADFWVISTNGQFSALGTSSPFTWASGDSITFSGSYEAA